MTADVALEVTDLAVHYGKRIAVDGVGFRLRKGEIAALLGPNGAGKSTCLLAIAGGLMPSRGTIRIADADLDSQPLRARARVGFADQPPSLYDFYTVAEHISFVAETRGSHDDDAHRELLAALGLGGIADRFCRELSFGMRQRVGLAAALVGDVDVVLLDETLNGLDPHAAKSARAVLRSTADRGVAVLMSTHLLGVAERLCDRIMVMDQGVLQRDVGGEECQTLLARGPGAIEELYLSLVRDGEVR